MTDNTNREQTQSQKTSTWRRKPDTILLTKSKTHQRKRHGGIMKENDLKHQQTFRASKVYLSPLKENQLSLRTSALDLRVS